MFLIIDIVAIKEERRTIKRVGEGKGDEKFERERERE